VKKDDCLKKEAAVLNDEECQTVIRAFVEQMRDECLMQDRGGLYGFVQRSMAYNSNRIEGSTLTEDETATLFETRELYPDDGTVYRAKDVEEMSGHFLMFNHMMKNIGNPLTEQLIKEFHFQLMSGVFEFRANGYTPGAYKRKRNTVARIVTSEPAAVPQDMKNLFGWYGRVEKKDLSALALFHVKFETIHPFQDGNGRVGRIILFRECLEHGILPFIIRDATKQSYRQALHAYQTNASDQAHALTEYFQGEQTAFYEQMREFMREA
jgi:Fic family protein